MIDRYCIVFVLPLIGKITSEDIGSLCTFCLLFLLVNVFPKSTFLRWYSSLASMCLRKMLVPHKTVRIVTIMIVHLFISVLLTCHKKFLALFPLACYIWGAGRETSHFLLAMD